MSDGSREKKPGGGPGQATSGGSAASTPGKRTLLEGEIARTGRPAQIPDAARERLEAQAAVRLDGVRLHTDDAAATVAAEHDARAVTIGQDIHFGSGELQTPDADHLLAHEVAHTIQQRDGAETAAAKSRDGRGSGAAEIEADHFADSFASGGAVSPIGVSTGIRPAAKPRTAPVPFAPRIKAKTQSLTVGVGETASVKFTVENAESAPHGTAFTWRGPVFTGPTDVAAVKVSDGDGTHGEVEVKGSAAGVTSLALTLHFEARGGGAGDVVTPAIRVEVGSHLDRAQRELTAVETDRQKKEMGKGGEVDEQRELTAQQEAVAAAQESMGTASNTAGTEISTIITHVSSAIDQIESARARGYAEALTHIDLKQLDKTATPDAEKSFLLSLAGNLVWALSGLIAVTPAGAAVELAELTAFAAAQIAARKAVLATVVGTAGAMLAQFANGLPSGAHDNSKIADPLISMEQQLNGINALLCNQSRRDMYSLIVSAMQAAPPKKGLDAQAYAGQLEFVLRHLLFGDLYEKGAAKGGKIDESIVQTDARDQLLRRTIVTTSALGDDADLRSTKIDAEGVGKVMPDALSLIGGNDKVALSEWELVEEQITRATRELQIEAVFDPKTTEKALAAGQPARIPAYWRMQDGVPAAFWGGMYATPWSKLASSGVVTVRPEMWGAEYFVGSELPKVWFLEIRPAELASGAAGKDGATVRSLKNIWISALGDPGNMGMAELDHDPIPSTDMWIVYRI